MKEEKYIQLINIDKFDYTSDILYGIEVITSNMKSGEAHNYTIFWYR